MKQALATQGQQVSLLRHQPGLMEAELGDYPARFPLARSVPRRWTLYVGPTNSGKTYTALKVLKAATRGAYLAPLRLMALENADVLNEAGVKCTLVTGEERRTVPGARHVACTIEMADLGTLLDVAVVDEAQLLLDPDRGWAWTQALVGLPAEHLVLTGSPECEAAIVALAGRLAEALTVVTLDRKSPLVVRPAPVKVRDLRAGDALVVFSRRAALDWRAALMGQGFSVATLYGALGPDVRRHEARRFRDGQAQLLVATDAIGMGLNLPIGRVVFAELDKFDGQQRRPLTSREIRQIGGRAGRFGLHPHGEVAVLDQTDRAALYQVRHALEGGSRSVGAPPPFVWLPWSVLATLEGYTRRPGLAALLDQGYRQALDPTLWRAPTLAPLLAVAQVLDRTALPLATRYRYLGCPTDGEGGPVLARVGQWALAHGQAQVVPWPHVPAATGTDEVALAHEELAARLAVAYLWLAQRWPMVFIDRQAAQGRQGRANAFIEHALAHTGERACVSCGRLLSARHKPARCQDCSKHDRRLSQRRR